MSSSETGLGYTTNSTVLLSGMSQVKLTICPSWLPPVPTSYSDGVLEKACSEYAEGKAMSSPLSPKSNFGDFFLAVTGEICTPEYDMPIFREYKPLLTPFIRPNDPPDLIIGTLSLFLLVS